MPRILLHLTDGRTTGGLKAINPPAKALRDSEVKIYSVGIGGSVNEMEMKMVSGSALHVFLMKDFDVLETFVDEVVAILCNGRCVV